MEREAQLTERFSALAAMGFRRADASPIPSETETVSGGRYRVVFSHPSMGTLVTTTAIHSSKALLEEALGSALAEMDRVVALLNRYDPGSALSSLNDAGVIHAPPPELSSVLDRALQHHAATGGVFDPTVQPLVDLFRSRMAPVGSSGAHPPLPTSAEIGEVLPLVDAGALERTHRTIRFSRGGMGLTLDGIAKGFVVDRVASVLSGHGLSDFLVNAGGDIRSSGFREDGTPWRVGIQDPEKTGSFPDVIPLSGGAVATSGSYEVYFDPELKHHHIVGSFDGRSPGESVSVSVVAPSATEADALATSLLLMPPRVAANFIDTLPGCACLIVDRTGRQVRSARWRSAADPTTTKAGTP